MSSTPSCSCPQTVQRKRTCVSAPGSACAISSPRLAMSSCDQLAGSRDASRQLSSRRMAAFSGSLSPASPKARSRLFGTRNVCPRKTTVSCWFVAVFAGMSSSQSSSNSICSSQREQAIRAERVLPNQKLCSANNSRLRRPKGQSATLPSGTSGSAAVNSKRPRSSGCSVLPLSQRSSNPELERARILRRNRGECRFLRFRHAGVTFEAFVFELYVLDGNGICVGVEIGHRLVFRHPAAEDLVGNNQLSGFIVELEINVFAEVCQRHFGAQAGPEIPHQSSPVMEFHVLSEAAVESYSVVFGSARRFVGRRGITPIAMFNHLSRALQPRELAAAVDVLAVPFQPELEILVGI